MHELSIAQSLVEVALAAAEQAQATRIKALHLRLGLLAGVVKEALLFSYEIATADTLLAESRLIIEEVPVMIYCPHCAQTSILPDIQAFRCRYCGAFSADIRQGRELEIHSLEIEVADEPTPYS
jgi:hydrogenase nickel incorporation protein HypA/HybF